MRYALISLNIILAVLLAFGMIKLFRNGNRGKKTFYTVKKVTRTEIPKKNVRKPMPRETVSPDEMQKAALENNIFDSSRCPSAVDGNIRTTMTLVGTFSAGDTSGAIILQKSTSRNNGFMMGPPPMMGGGRRMGFTQNNGNSRNNNRTGNRNRGSFDGGMMPPMPPGTGPGRMNQNNNAQTAAARLKQYVRIGETLENGYKLISVSRTGATFERSGERLELEIQEASKNAPKTPAKTNTNSRQNMMNQINRMVQGMQNMQRQQGFQNMQMMRMMQQNMNPQSGGGNRSGGGRRR